MSIFLTFNVQCINMVQIMLHRLIPIFNFFKTSFTDGATFSAFGAKFPPLKRFTTLVFA